MPTLLQATGFSGMEWWVDNSQPYNEGHKVLSTVASLSRKCIHYN